MKNYKIQDQNNQLSLLQVAEIEVSYHPHFKACDRPKVNSSSLVYDILHHNWNSDTIEYREEFNILHISVYSGPPVSVILGQSYR